MHGAHDGRYAPSPTGQLHLGNLRTALAAWLRARSSGGRFRLRIDDLDPDRSRPEHEASQIADLRSLGIDWDDVPVRQSSRLDRYHQAIEALERDGRTFPCFCTRAEVHAAATAPHGAAADGAYPGTCSQLAVATAARRIAAGDPHCIRVRADSERVGFDDLLLGRVDRTVDDFVIRRRDAVPAYNLASAIDEHDLGIGEVLRGADLAETTPRQIWLACALQLEPLPRFAHVPLVLGPDGARLSKRHGATSLTDLESAGATRAAVLQLLAGSLGFDIAGPAWISLDALVEGFDATRIPREPILLDPTMLIEQGATAAHDDGSTP